MSDTMTGRWWAGIRRRAHDRDIERQLRYGRTRGKAIAAWRAMRARWLIPDLVPEFLKVLIGSMIGFWLIAAALSWAAGVPRLYTYVVAAFLFSLQATYYRNRLVEDPEFTIRRCNCGGVRADRSEAVLSSSESTTLGVPNSTLAAALYIVMLVVLRTGHDGLALLAAIAGVLASSYLAWVMIVRIGGLCTTCVNIAALNCLILWQLL